MTPLWFTYVLNFWCRNSGAITVSQLPYDNFSFLGTSSFEDVTTMQLRHLGWRVLHRRFSLNGVWYGRPLPRRQRLGSCRRLWKPKPFAAFFIDFIIVNGNHGVVQTFETMACWTEAGDYRLPADRGAHNVFKHVLSCAKKISVRKQTIEVGVVTLLVNYLYEIYTYFF